MRRLFASCLLLAMVPMTGCSWLTGDEGYFRDRSDDYRLARVDSPLQVPTGLSADALQEMFVIPAITEDISVTGEFAAPRPAPLISGSADELVRIQKLADEQWMLVSTAPGQLWPQVRGYLSRASIPVARVEARDGIIETGWIAAEGNALQQRFRFRIEQGVQRNTSELHVLQMFQTGNDGVWPRRSADGEKERAMMMELAQFVANSVEDAPVSMMAQQAISATGRVSMQEDETGNPYIRLDLPFHRGWASLERALQDSSFEILDKDRSQRVYFVHYVAPAEQESGWLSWMFGGNEDAEVEVLTRYDYRLQLSEQVGESIIITITRDDGGQLSQQDAQSILALIKGNIS